VANNVLGKILHLSASSLKVEIISFLQIFEITQYTGLHGVRTEKIATGIFTAAKICDHIDRGCSLVNLD
jgi:hypothetical protein